VVTEQLACEAMATRFELVLHGPNATVLRAAGEEAIAEIQRVEAVLSIYRADSEIAAINRAAARAPVRVTPEVFRLIEAAILLSHATEGAFDITVAPLMRAWGLMQGSGQLPAAEDVANAMQCVGSSLIELDPARFQIGFRKPGVMLDMGSIGKGYALDRAVEVLREAGISSALVHGGTSTSIAIGVPRQDAPWRVAIDPPRLDGAAKRDAPEKPLAIIDLCEESLSVSAVWGKGFQAGERYYGHVIDPRLGRPVEGTLLSAVVLPSAAESDALSTALLVRGCELLQSLPDAGHQLRCLVVESDHSPAGYRVVTRGISTIVS
jgi:thiamine biosynthesis lipoprotein